jgi:GTP-binding protein HflX
MSIVIDVLDVLGAAGIPRITVLNKIDALADRGELAPLLVHEQHAVAVSARTGEGIEALEALLQDHLAASERRIEILVPHRAAALHAEIRRSTTVLAESYTEEGCLMECLISPSLLDRLVSKGAILPNGQPRHREPTPE